MLVVVTNEAIGQRWVTNTKGVLLIQSHPSAILSGDAAIMRKQWVFLEMQQLRRIRRMKNCCFQGTSIVKLYFNQFLEILF